MSVIEYEDRIAEIVNKEEKSEFLYDLLEIYDIPKATITRLKNGHQNLAKKPGEVHLKNRVWYKEAEIGKLFDAFVELEKDVEELSARPRYLLVTDFEDLLAKDTKTNEPLDIKFKDLPQHFAFFLAWKGIEKVDFEKESPADIRAAERVARIYDIVRKENDLTDNKRDLDLFFIRLLFCLFAEDTDIFKRKIFTNSIKTLTKEDGSDLNQFFTDLFAILNQQERDNVPNYLNEFPYVNGQLFSKPHQNLKFSKKARKLIIESGELLNWAEINPDIFGSMIQVIVSDDSRSQLGIHYTSVPNIMKVINPLFLDDLYKEFEQAYDSVDKLNLLLERIGKIKFFDPACGSGNFLIITYKELRRLEIKILSRKSQLTEDIMYLPSVTLNQFYGIEIDEFAHDVAVLSLWIADHQMNVELEKTYGDKVRATLPLQSAGYIYCGNALRVNWLDICPVDESEEVYVFGNPPYLGSKKQNNKHKADMHSIFKNVKNGRMLDYISGWFYLGAKYSQATNARIAFVSTNSITHGEQVYTLWNELYKFNIEIDFAYRAFKWTNNARGNAGVTVVILGFSPINTKKKKYLYLGETKKEVSDISPYLTEGETVLVSTRRSPVSNLPIARFGSMPNDGGNLLLTRDEYNELISENPGVKRFIRKFVGSEEFIHGLLRYCIWIQPEEVSEAMKYTFIKERVEKIKQLRLNSKRQATRELAKTPYAFGENRHQDSTGIVIPATSSENRLYIPMGLTDRNTVYSNSAYVIYGADLYLLGVLMSKMHMTWTKSVGGRLESRFRYSVGLCYNTFPLPELSVRRKNEITKVVLDIIDIREEIGGTLAELYNPETMPLELKKAHEQLDRIVDRAYQQRAFENDEERLSLLLKLYQEMTGK